MSNIAVALCVVNFRNFLINWFKQINDERHFVPFNAINFKLSNGNGHQVDAFQNMYIGCF